MGGPACTELQPLLRPPIEFRLWGETGTGVEKVYTHVSRDVLKEIYVQAHPRAFKT